MKPFASFSFIRHVPTRSTPSGATSADTAKDARVPLSFCWANSSPSGVKSDTSRACSVSDGGRSSPSLWSVT